MCVTFLRIPLSSCDELESGRRGWISRTLVQVHHLWFSVFLRVVSLRFSCFVCLLFLIAFCLFLSVSPLYLTVWWDSFSSFISVCSTSDFPLVKMAGDSGVAGNAHSSYDTWFQACSPSCRFLFLFFVCAYLIVYLWLCCIFSLVVGLCGRELVFGWIGFL